MKITIIFARLPVVQISEKQREEIKDILSRATDQMIDNPRKLDGIISVGEMLLSENTDAMDVYIADMILDDILNNPEKSEEPAPPELKKLWEEWELIRDSILADNMPEHHCKDCDSCDKCDSGS